MPKMIFANAKNSDMFYATKASAHDPFFYLDDGRKKCIFLDHRELGVFQDKNKNVEIEAVLLDPLLADAMKDKNKTSLSNKLALLILKKYKLGGGKILVPTSFPLDMADFLRAKGVKISPQSSFFPERIIKTKVEVEYVRENMRRLCKAFDRVEEILMQSRIKGDEIKFKNKTLTSEILKHEIELVLMREGLNDTEGMIVSCGTQAAIPHHSGTGVLRPNQTIICDIFPQSRVNHYFGDMTRTYVKGEPSIEVKKMYAAVLEAQEKALLAIRPGKSGREIYQLCVDIFLARGFHVGDRGFVHGTGHGLGIDIHEDPYLNKYSEDLLEEGNIFSIEPGLYYPEFGGVRIEDLVVVTKKGSENLTKYHKQYIIA